MRTTEVRYTGPSPARSVPGVGLMKRGEWMKAANDVCERLAASDSGWFEVRDEAPPKAATKGAQK